LTSKQVYQRGGAAGEREILGRRLTVGDVEGDGRTTSIATKKRKKKGSSTSRGKKEKILLLFETGNV